MYCVREYNKNSKKFKYNLPVCAQPRKILSVSFLCQQQNTGDEGAITAIYLISTLFLKCLLSLFCNEAIVLFAAISSPLLSTRS